MYIMYFLYYNVYARTAGYQTVWCSHKWIYKDETWRVQAVDRKTEFD